MKLRRNNIKPKRDRPGHVHETHFNDYLSSMFSGQLIYDWSWPALTQKSDFDFIVEKVSSYVFPSTSFVYIDVVGWYWSEQCNSYTVRLNTAHHDYNKKLLSRPHLHSGSNLDRVTWSGEAYLAFDYNGSWRFLHIVPDLPRGDITLTKSRLAGLRGEKTVFGESNKVRRAAVLEYIESLSYPQWLPSHLYK